MAKAQLKKVWDITDLVDETMELIKLEFMGGVITVDPNKLNEWLKVRGKFTKNAKRNAGVNELSDIAQNRVDIRSMFETVVLDWTGLVYQGRPLVFTSKEDREVMVKVALKKPFIIDQISDVLKRAGVEEEDELKNSEGTPSGGSNPGGVQSPSKSKDKK